MYHIVILQLLHNFYVPSFIMRTYAYNIALHTNTDDAQQNKFVKTDLDGFIFLCKTLILGLFES